jgi:chemotaxis protein CheD
VAQNLFAVNTGPNQLRAVTIGAVVTSRIPDDVLVAYGLGSCVAVCLYDPVTRVGGMLHALLPSAPDNSKGQDNRAKFVDEGIPLLIAELTKLGARHSRLITLLCGGAKVLSIPGLSDDGVLNIGKRNVLAAEVALREARLRVKAQDTGGTVGRTVKLYIASGQVTVRSLGQKEQPLT